jgi:hypothetical protein
MTTREQVLKQLDDIVALIDSINGTLSSIAEQEKRDADALNAALTKWKN